MYDNWTLLKPISFLKKLRCNRFGSKPKSGIELNSMAAYKERVRTGNHWSHGRIVVFCFVLYASTNGMKNLKIIEEQ